jgi:hypothetical protein
MSRGELLGIILSVLAVLVIPALALLVRITVKWQRIEDRLGEITGDLTQLVKDKGDAHKALFDLIRSDREQMDTRVRWLEQNLWNRPRR